MILFEREKAVRKTEMKVFYDNEIDALYLKLGDDKPEGVTELVEGVNVDVTPDGKLVGLEIIEASKKLDIKTILSYSLELERDILRKNVA